MTLVCPSCGLAHAAEERFCRRCGLPLVPEGGPAEAVVDERRARMRKIKPQYSEGELVRVAGGRNQAEAEFIQGLLLEEGVPSMLRRSGGFDVPDFLAAGPRDILVPQAAYEVASQLLADTGEHLAEGVAAAGADRPLRLLVGFGIAVAVAVAIVWGLFQLAT